VCQLSDSRLASKHTVTTCFDPAFGYYHFPRQNILEVNFILIIRVIHTNVHCSSAVVMSAMMISQKLCQNIPFLLFKRRCVDPNGLSHRTQHPPRTLVSNRRELFCSLLFQFCSVNKECPFYHFLEQRNRIDSLYPPGHHVRDAAL
jgi:hypothetical protein